MANHISPMSKQPVSRFFEQNLLTFFIKNMILTNLRWTLIVVDSFCWWQISDGNQLLRLQNVPLRGNQGLALAFRVHQREERVQQTLQQASCCWLSGDGASFGFCMWFESLVSPKAKPEAREQQPALSSSHGAAAYLQSAGFDAGGRSLHCVFCK